MGGWIKLHRDILAWEWWDNDTMVKSWLTILMLCNPEDRKWQGRTIKAGSFVTSLSRLSVCLGLTVDRTRTVLYRLKETGEITVQTNRHFTLVSVNNWERYQSNDKSKDEENPKPQHTENQIDKSDFSEQIPNKSQTEPKPTPNQSQTNPRQIPTTKEIKEYREPIGSLSDVRASAQAREKESVLPFEMFWEMYGKKCDRKACETAYARIPEREKAKIKEHVPRYVASTPEVRYRKNPLTYLHGQCWNNEIIAKQQQQQQQNPNGRPSFDYAPDESGTGPAEWEVEDENNAETL